MRLWCAVFGHRIRWAFLVDASTYTVRSRWDDSYAARFCVRCGSEVPL